MPCWPPRPCFSMIIGHGSVSYLWMVTKRSCSALCPPSCARRSRCPAARLPGRRAHVPVRVGGPPEAGIGRITVTSPSLVFHPMAPSGGKESTQRCHWGETRLPGRHQRRAPGRPAKTTTGQTAEYPTDRGKREPIPRRGTSGGCQLDLRRLPPCPFWDRDQGPKHAEGLAEERQADLPVGIVQV